QVERLREEVSVSPRELVDTRVPGGEVTDEGLRQNVSIGIQYIASWLRGTGAAAINNLMEDAATAEISRSQVWQWVHSGRFTRVEVQRAIDDEVAKLPPQERLEDARRVFERGALADC